MALRVAVHDDRRLVREGLALLLSDEPDLVVIAPTDHEPPPDVIIAGPAGASNAPLDSSARVVAFDDGMTVEMILAAVRADDADLRPKSRSISPPRASAMALTRREVEILRFIAAGLSATEVSNRLGISHKTVENHKRRIFAKLDVQNQAHAVAVATRAGLLEGG